MNCPGSNFAAFCLSPRPRGDALRAKPPHIDLSIDPFQHFNEHFLLLHRLFIVIIIIVILQVFTMKGVGSGGGLASSSVLWTQPWATIHSTTSSSHPTHKKIHRKVLLQKMQHIVLYCKVMHVLVQFFVALGLAHVARAISPKSGKIRPRIPAFQMLCQLLLQI